MKESGIQRQILDYLNLRKVWHRRMNSGATRMNGRVVYYGAKGLPDIFARTHAGSIIWIEVKADKGKQNDDQKTWQEDAERFGDVYILARSLDDVRALFEPRREHENT
jgi:hypothetical protein